MVVGESHPGYDLFGSNAYKKEWRREGQAHKKVHLRTVEHTVRAIGARYWCSFFVNKQILLKFTCQISLSHIIYIQRLSLSLSIPQRSTKPKLS